MTDRPPPNAADSGTWQLGDKIVNRMGYGALRITGSGAFDTGVPRERDAAIHVLRAAFELGVNHIDTAAFYFSTLRSANELINAALRPYPAELVIATKVGPSRDPSGEWIPLKNPAMLRGQVEQNLRELGLDALDLVNLRLLPETGRLSDQLEVLVEAQQDGLIRAIGISNARLDQVREAQTLCRVACVQNSYALGYRRRQDELVDHCREHGIAFVPFFALAAQAREGGYAVETDSDVSAVAAEHGISAAQVRLAWTLHRGPHLLAIPGTGNLQHLRENVAAGAVRLTDSQWARLDAVHARGPW